VSKLEHLHSLQHQRAYNPCGNKKRLWIATVDSCLRDMREHTPLQPCSKASISSLEMPQKKFPGPNGQSSVTGEHPISFWNTLREQMRRPEAKWFEATYGVRSM